VTRSYRQRRPRRAATEPSARTPAIDPNVIERSTLYLGLAEFADPEARHRPTTIDAIPSPTRRSRHAR